MIRDAAILISLINQVIKPQGFVLHDGHLNNVSFHKGKPIFTDIGSIVENHGQDTMCNREILFTAVYRLIFNNIGNSILKHVQLYDETNNAIWVRPRYYDDYTREYTSALRVFEHYHFWHSSSWYRKIIFKMFKCYDVRPEYIEILFPLLTDTTSLPSANILQDIDKLFELIEQAKLSLSSLVDMGGNHGEVASAFYEKYGRKATALECNDTDSMYVYKRFKENHQPLNTFIFHYLYGASVEKIDAIRSDIATCLDITHTCTAFQMYRPDSLFNSLSKISKKYVAISYYPNKQRSLKYIPYLLEDEKEDIQAFERVFNNFYKIIEKAELGDNPQDSEYRIIYLGRKL